MSICLRVSLGLLTALGLSLGAGAANEAPGSNDCSQVFDYAVKNAHAGTDQFRGWRRRRLDLRCYESPVQPHLCEILRPEVEQAKAKVRNGDTHSGAGDLDSLMDILKCR